MILFNPNSRALEYRGQQYVVESNAPFASGFHGNVFLARRVSDGKLFALKVAKQEADPALSKKHLAELQHEHETTMPVLKNAGLVPSSFETHLLGDGTALLKSYVRGPTLGALIRDGDFFKPNSVAKEKFVALIQSQIEAGRFVGDLSPDNVVFTLDNRCIVIDSNEPVEGLDPAEAARLYRGESTVHYGERDLNRYSLNAQTGKWGKFIDKNLGGFNAQAREEVRRKVQLMLDDITTQYLGNWPT